MDMQDATAFQVEQDRADMERAENEGMNANTPPSAVADSPLMGQELGGGDNSHPSSREVEPAAERLPVAALPDRTDLERRVLAHERILQTLIAHISETEPRFLERLTSTFCLPMEMARREHDYTDTDSYAEAFVRELINRGERPGGKPPVSDNSRQPGNSAQPARNAANDAPRHKRPPIIATSRTGGVSHVTKDGQFYGDYLKAEHAAEAAGAVRGTVRKAD